MNEELEKKIQEESDLVKSSISYHDKMEHQNNLLQLKVNFPTNKYKAELYPDLKLFMKLYLDSLDEQKNHYDELQLDKIYNYLQKVDSDEQIKLLRYLIRLLKLYGYDDLMEECECKLAKTELKHIVQNFKFGHVLKLLYLITTYNMFSIVLSFILFFVLTSICLLPAPSWSFPLVSIEYHHYSDSFSLNHALNILSSPIGLSDDFKVVPINCGGFWLCLIGKGLFLILIVNVLTRHFEKKIKI